MTLAEDKAVLRVAGRERRRLAAVRGGDAARRVRDLLLAEFDPAPSTPIAGYWPLAEELDVRPALQALFERHCRCLLPAVIGPDQALVFRHWQPGDQLRTTAFGVREPDPVRPAVDPRIMLVPLIAFDDAGHRLGFGGGFYDRTLAALRHRPKGPPLAAIGVAFACQQVDSVPHDGFDQPLDGVVTERGALRID